MGFLQNVYYKFRDSWQRHNWIKSLNHSVLHGEVLMFHHITNEYVEIIPSCRCSIKVFEHYLNAYEKDGFRFVSVTEALNIIREGKDSRPFCVITFDDIPDNVYQNAYPILKKRGIPFTIFVATKYVDWVNPDTGEVYITMDHLMEMESDSLCTVGAHTTTHMNLLKVSNPQKEILENKEWLESKLGHPVDYLAYPHGKNSNVSRKIRQIAKDAGFKCAFGTIEAPITDKSSQHTFFLPRIPKY